MTQTNDRCPADTREGRDCEQSRRSTARLLFPGNRPGIWLLVLGLAFLVVLVHEVLIRMA